MKILILMLWGRKPLRTLLRRIRQHLSPRFRHYVEPYSLPLYNELDEMFDRSIEELRLSPEVMKILKWEGLTSIGSCLIFYVLGETRARAHLPSRLHWLMYGQVFQRLVEQGHWRFIENPTSWQALSRGRFVRGGKKLALWQEQERDLCTIPVEALGLSAQTTQYLCDRYATNVCRCITTYQGDRRRTDSSNYSAKLAAAREEIEAKLHDLGYLVYIEHPDSLV